MITDQAYDCWELCYSNLRSCNLSLDSIKHTHSGHANLCFCANPLAILLWFGLVFCNGFELIIFCDSSQMSMPINSSVYNPTCTKQTFGNFRITADTGPFNVDALRVSVPLQVLQESPSHNRLVSLTLRSLIHSIDRFILHTARNIKYIHDFKIKIRGTDVLRRTGKISSQKSLDFVALLGTSGCYVLLIAFH